jgi:glycosyltransferase involved in cell wall biosynthesis
MHVLIVSPFPPPPDGIGAHTRFLAEAWRADGHEVHVVSRSAASEPGDEGPIVVHRTLSTRSDAAAVLDAAQPDVVVVQFAIPALTTAWPGAWSLMSAARRRGVPVVTACHEPLRELHSLRAVARQVYAQVAQRTDVAVAFSEGGAEALEAMGVASPVVLPLGVPTLPVVRDEDRSRVEGAYGVDSGTVLSLGFAHPDKGTDVLVEAVGMLRRRGRAPDTLIAGATRRRRGPTRVLELGDRRFERRFRRLAAEAPSVRFTGFVPDEDLAPLLAAVGVLVLPYRRTTQSGVAGLGIAAGMPIIASDLEGLRGALGDAALYVPAGDPNALSEALLDVATVATRQRLGASARERRTIGSIPVVARALIEVAARTAG